MIRVIITIRKSNNNSLEWQGSVYQSGRKRNTLYLYGIKPTVIYQLPTATITDHTYLAVHKTVFCYTSVYK
jgi:hypothetical protein